MESPATLGVYDGSSKAWSAPCTGEYIDVVPIQARGSRLPRRVLAIACVAMALMTASGSHARQARAARTVCEPQEEALFICETNRKDKYLAICAVETEVGKRWSAVQYRFGPEDRAELVYPEDARQGASKMFFSHVTEGTIYKVSVRFRSGDFTYKVESSGDSASHPVGDGAAGVTVTDATGKKVSQISCIERPTMFAPYLQRALACDLENPHGKAACGDQPYRIGRAKAPDTLVNARSR
jgi:hypothetical protein